MAYSPVQLLSVPIENYDAYWLKFYDQGTTNPLAMATDATGGTLIAQAEISSGGTVPAGFLQTAGSALLNPFVNGAYDAWLFPTEAEASANDTSNAIQLADNLNADPASTVNDTGLTATDKAAAVLITPVAGITLFVESSDGGWFQYKSGVGLTDNGGSYCGTQFIPTGGDGTIAWVRVFEGTLLDSWFGITIDGVTDFTTQVAAFHSAGVDLNKSIEYADGTFICGNFKRPSTLNIIAYNANWSISSVIIPIPSFIETNGAFTQYVATTGDDDLNNGLTASTPYAAIQHAWEAMPSNIRHYTNIQLADGTYNTNPIASGDQPRPAILWAKGKSTTLRSYLSGQNIIAPVTIKGNQATPANTIIETDANYVYGIYNNKGNLGLQDLTIQGDGVNKASSLVTSHRGDSFVHAINVYADGGAAGATYAAIVESSAQMEWINGEMKNCDVGGAAISNGDNLTITSQGSNIINNCTTGVVADSCGRVSVNMLQNGQGQVAVIDNTCTTGAKAASGGMIISRGQDYGVDTCQIHGATNSLVLENAIGIMIFSELDGAVIATGGSQLKMNSSTYQSDIGMYASDLWLQTSASYISPATENDETYPVVLQDGGRIYEGGTNVINGLAGAVTVPTYRPSTATFTANNQGFTLLDGRDSIRVISDAGNAWTGCYIDSTGITEGRIIHIDSDGVDPVQLSNTSGHMDINPAITFGNATGEYSGATFIMRDSKWRLVGLGQVRA